MFRGPFDKIFINFVDHGTFGGLGFPYDFLFPDDLDDALNYIHLTKPYSKVIFFNLVLCDI